ncbi:MAG: histidine phosphatase family protein [Candidatus Poribacteria bacterium]|nr:histidine phosphatase family protein [Candidatus Poribacteria bacterium]
MKTLLIMRHAKSSWNYPELSDYDRPLNGRGKREAPRMGKHLRQEGLVPDMILTSSAKRARSTANRVVKASGYAGKVKKLDALYDTVLGAYFKTLQVQPEKYQSVMVVGHNPTMEQLVEHLTGHIKLMPTAALAHIELPIERWETLDLYTKATLVNLWTPKTLFTD